MKQRTTTLLLLFLMLILVLGGCGSPAEEQPEIPDEPVISDEPETEPEPVIPMGTNPLTGLPLELDYVDDRPVAIIFNNLYQAMPQLGISQADIIYEIPAEGGITRMLGVYQTLNDVDTVGSIRSARPYFLEVALGHDAFLVHAGGSEDAYDNIRSWDVDNMDGVRGGNDAKIFWRDSERKKSLGYEHSLVTSGEKIQEYIDTTSWPKEHDSDYVYDQKFVEDGTPTEGSPAEYFELYFSHYKTGRFTYDETSGQYRIVQYNKPYTDGNTGEQVSVTNVLVLETDVRVISGDTEGRLKIRTTGTGEGTYFCGGKSIPIQWSREDRNHPFTYTTSDGTALTLEQGTTYICIMDPDQSKLTIPEPEVSETETEAVS
ncbi:MAG: DUF3048 domain-containing protein [Firmicutes bacterium]|nr:DUF3048 domain-containing protein [Bacillota bacterium]